MIRRSITLVMSGTGGDITNTTVSFQDFDEVRARLESVTRQDCMQAKWVEVPFTADGVRRSLFQLAPSIDEFRKRSDEMGALIDKID